MAATSPAFSLGGRRGGARTLDLGVERWRQLDARREHLCLVATRIEPLLDRAHPGPELAGDEVEVGDLAIPGNQGLLRALPLSTHDGKTAR